MQHMLTSLTPKEQQRGWAYDIPVEMPTTSIPQSSELGVIGAFDELNSRNCRTIV